MPQFFVAKEDASDDGAKRMNSLWCIRNQPKSISACKEVQRRC